MTTPIDNCMRDQRTVFSCYLYHVLRHKNHYRRRRLNIETLYKHFSASASIHIKLIREVQQCFVELSYLEPPWSASCPRLHISSLTFNKATVDIPQTVKDSLRKFRFSKRNSGSAAIVIKIIKAKLVMEVEEQYDNISIEELAEGKFTPDTYADQEPND